MRAHPPHSSLEILEPRIAPANVVAVMIDGELVIRPEKIGKKMEVIVTQTGSEAFELSDDNGPIASFLNVDALKIRGGENYDHIGINMLDVVETRFNGRVTVIAGGFYGDGVGIGRGNFGGDVVIRGAYEASIEVSENAVIAGILKIVGTQKRGAVELSGQLHDVVIKNMLYVDIRNFHATGDVHVEGRPNTDIYFNILANTQIDGDLSFVNSSEFKSYLEFEELTLGGAADFHFGGFYSYLTVIDSSIEGPLRASSSGYGYFVDLAATTVHGTARFDTRGDTNSIRVASGSVLESKLVVTSNDSTNADFIFVVNSTINGLFAVRTSALKTAAEFQGATLLGGIDVRDGNGNVRFSADADTQIVGRVDFEAGDGKNVLSILEVGGLTNVHYVGGTGRDHLELAGTGGSSLQVLATLGKSADTARVVTASFLRVAMDGGNDSDTLLDGDALTGPNVNIAHFEVFAAS